VLDEKGVDAKLAHPTSLYNLFTATKLLFDYSLPKYTIDKAQGILYAV